MERNMLDRRKWYESMQQPLVDHRSEVDRIRSLAKASFHTSSKASVSLPTSSRAEESSQSKARGELGAIKTDYFLVALTEIPVLPPDHPTPPTTVVCFPGVGSSFTVFSVLAQRLFKENKAQVYGVCFPGRMHRAREVPSADTTLPKLIQNVRQELIERRLVSPSPEQKVVFVGHDMGCLVAYEVCRSLLRNHYHVSGIVVCSMRSPFRQTMFNFTEDPLEEDAHTIGSHEEAYSRASSRGSHMRNNHSSHGHSHPHSSHGHSQSHSPASRSHHHSPQHSQPASVHQSQLASHASSPAQSTHHGHAHAPPTGKKSLLASTFRPQSPSAQEHLSPKAVLTRDASYRSAISYLTGDGEDGEDGARTATGDGETAAKTSYFHAHDDLDLLTPLLHTLTPKQLVTAMFRMGALPPPLHERRDLLHRRVPLLQRDLQWLQQYFVSPPVIPGVPYHEQLTVTAEDVQDLLEMPPSMFKLHIPVYAVHGEQDAWIRSEETTAWSLTSNAYDHRVLEDCGHYYFHDEEAQEVLLTFVGRVQARTADADDDDL